LRWNARRSASSRAARNRRSHSASPSGKRSTTCSSSTRPFGEVSPTATSRHRWHRESDRRRPRRGSVAEQGTPGSAPPREPILECATASTTWKSLALSPPHAGPITPLRRPVVVGSGAPRRVQLPAYAPPDDLLEGLAYKMVEPDTSDAFLNTNPRLSPGSRSSLSSLTTTSHWTPRRWFSSRRTPTPPSTSGRHGTTWTRSTGVGRDWTLSFMIRPNRPSCC